MLNQLTFFRKLKFYKNLILYDILIQLKKKNEVFGAKNAKLTFSTEIYTFLPFFVSVRSRNEENFVKMCDEIEKFSKLKNSFACHRRIR